MPEPDFSPHFYSRLNKGAESAAQKVDKEYRSKLCALVEKEMGRRFAAREDPEDPVQSAMRSFYRGINAGRFRIDNSAALWALLETIVRRKVLKHVERQGAAKRDPDRETPADSQWLPAREPRPEDAVHATDLIEQALDGLEDPDPEVLRLRLAGCTRADIAERVGCTEASVRFKLDRIRDRLRRLSEDDSA